MSRSIHAAPGESLPYNHHLHQFRAFLKHERGFADATIVNRERKLPSPNRLLRPTNTLADILYLFAQPNPATNKSRIAHAKPIAPPRPPQTPATSSKSPYRKCPGVKRSGPRGRSAPAHLSIEY
jgi:hypothetical protein